MEIQIGDVITVAVVVKEKIITKDGELYKVELDNPENRQFGFSTILVRPQDIVE